MTVGILTSMICLAAAAVVMNTTASKLGKIRDLAKRATPHLSNNGNAHREKQQGNANAKKQGTHSNGNGNFKTHKPSGNVHVYQNSLEFPDPTGIRTRKGKRSAWHSRDYN